MPLVSTVPVTLMVPPNVAASSEVIWRRLPRTAIVLRASCRVSPARESVPMWTAPSSGGHGAVLRPTWARIALRSSLRRPAPIKADWSAARSRVGMSRLKLAAGCSAGGGSQFSPAGQGKEVEYDPWAVMPFTERLALLQVTLPGEKFAVAEEMSITFG